MLCTFLQKMFGVQSINLYPIIPGILKNLIKKNSSVRVWLTDHVQQHRKTCTSIFIDVPFAGNERFTRVLIEKHPTYTATLYTVNLKENILLTGILYNKGCPQEELGINKNAEYQDRAHAAYLEQVQCVARQKTCLC